MAKDESTGPEAIRAIEERLLGIAQGLKQAFAAAEEAVKAGGGVHETTIETPRGPLVAKSMVRMRMGGLAANLGAAAADREHPPEPRPQVREPMVDVYEEADALVITAELPGVSEPEIATAWAGGVFVIETTGERAYRAQVPLPAGVALDADRREQRLVNGILEIRIPKEAPDVG